MASSRGRVLAVAVLLALPGASRGSIAPVREAPGQVTAARGLVLRLGEGEEAPGRETPVTRARAIPLSDADTAKVLERLPALPPVPDEEEELALREECP